jgi:hypothetical protein
MIATAVRRRRSRLVIGLRVALVVVLLLMLAQTFGLGPGDHIALLAGVELLLIGFLWDAERRWKRQT